MRKDNQELFKDGVWSFGFFHPTNMEDQIKLRTSFYRWLKEETDLEERFVPEYINEGLWAEVRSPDSNWSALEYAQDMKSGHLRHGWTNTDGFHQDANGEITFMFCWANTRPTEVRKLHSKELIVPKPFEVIGFNNAIYEHRMPTNMHISTARKRYFIRSWNNRNAFR